MNGHMEQICDNLRADGWADPDEAAKMEAKIEILRAAVQRAVDYLAKRRREGVVGESIGVDIGGVESELASALNTTSGEVR